jgi:hypothetical protein
MDLDTERQGRSALAYDQQTLLAKMIRLETEIILLRAEKSPGIDGKSSSVYQCVTNTCILNCIQDRCMPISRVRSVTDTSMSS